MVVLLLTSAEGLHGATTSSSSLMEPYDELSRHIQTSFGDCIDSISFEIAEEVPQPPRLLQRTVPQNKWHCRRRWSSTGKASGFTHQRTYSNSSKCWTIVKDPQPHYSSSNANQSDQNRLANVCSNLSGSRIE